MKPCGCCASYKFTGIHQCKDWREYPKCFVDKKLEALIYKSRSVCD